MDAAVVAVVAVAGLLVATDVFELPAVLVGLLLWPKQRPARPSDNAAIVIILIFIIWFSC